MSKSFHESYSRGEVMPPSERSTGLLFAVIAVIVAAWWRQAPLVPWVALGIAGALALLSLAAPRTLRPLNLLWFQIGMLLHRVVNPIVMFAIFAIVFLPAGLIMRLRYDPLGSRRAGSGASYWKERASGAQGPGSMTNQF